MFRTFLAIHALFGGAMAAVAVISAYALGLRSLVELCAAANLGVVLITPLSLVVWREVREFHEVTRHELGRVNAPLPVTWRD